MKQLSPSFLLPITLQRSNPPCSLAEQIANEVRSLIDSKQLQPGDQLPAQRALSSQLKVGRVTVMAAYNRLTEEGYLVTRVGSGTVVTDHLPLSEAETWTASFEGSLSSKRLNRLSQHMPLAAKASHYRPQKGIPFAIVTPENTLLPGKKWEQIVSRVSRSPWLHNGYSEPAGYKPFRIAIADYLRRTRGVVCSHEQLIITNGIQQGLHLCAQLLFNQNDTIFVENPGFPVHRDLLTYTGLKTQPVPIDENGIKVNQFTKLSHEAKGALVTPSHQYPLGTLMTLDRRQELLEWAYATNSWIIEDDYDSELRYGGAPYPALQSLDLSREAVIYLGTFTKMIYPGFGLGYMVVPKILIDAFVGAKFLNDRHASEVHQVILTEFINDGFYEAHIRRLKLIHERRRQAMFSACKKYLSTWGQIIPTNQGTHLTFVFHEFCNDIAVAQYLQKNASLELKPLSDCYCENADQSGFLLGFGGFSEDQINSSIKRLADELTKLNEAGFNTLEVASSARTA